MRSTLMFIVTLILLVSCKTSKYTEAENIKIVEKEVPIVNTKIEYRDRLVYDSIYIKDSIYTFIKGDTVYITKNRETNHIKGKADTIAKIDTIRVPVTITTTLTKKETKIKEINKLYWWQKILTCLGVLTLIAGIMILIIKIKKV